MKKTNGKLVKRHATCCWVAKWHYKITDGWLTLELSHRVLDHLGITFFQCIFPCRKMCQHFSFYSIHPKPSFCPKNICIEFGELLTLVFFSFFFNAFYFLCNYLFHFVLFPCQAYDGFLKSSLLPSFSGQNSKNKTWVEKYKKKSLYFIWLNS